MSNVTDIQVAYAPLLGDPDVRKVELNQSCDEGSNLIANDGEEVVHEGTSSGIGLAGVMSYERLLRYDSPNAKVKGGRVGAVFALLRGPAEAGARGQAPVRFKKACTNF